MPELRSVRVALGREQFRQLIRGEEVVATNTDHDTVVHFILSNIGFAVMQAELDEAIGDNE